MFNTGAHCGHVLLRNITELLACWHTTPHHTTLNQPSIWWFDCLQRNHKWIASYFPPGLTLTLVVCCCSVAASFVLCCHAASPLVIVSPIDWLIRHQKLDYLSQCVLYVDIALPPPLTSPLNLSLVWLAVFACLHCEDIVIAGSG